MREKTQDMYKDAVEKEPCMWYNLLPYLGDVECSIDNLQLLTECQKLQNKVLYRVNMELAKTNDALAQAYAVQGQDKFIDLVFIEADRLPLQVILHCQHTTVL